MSKPIMNQPETEESAKGPRLLLVAEGGEIIQSWFLLDAGDLNKPMPKEALLSEVQEAVLEVLYS